VIPYVKIPELIIGPLPLHAFGLLVATGVIIGTALATSRARRRGFDLDLLHSFITWMLVGGFVAGHVLDEVFYHPDDIARDPLSLLKLWAGLSSFGAFTGAAVGIFLWKYFDYLSAGSPGSHGRRGFVRNHPARPLLPFADLILSVFPVAWIFGRSGCSSVHDHPGEVAGPADLLAVEFPSFNPNYTGDAGKLHTFGPITFVEGKLLHGHFPRYDLGLLELKFTIVLAGAIALTWQKRLPTGTYVVVTALACAPVRFAMDFLRIRGGEDADPRYGGLTPAQWACVALFAYGLYMLMLALRLREQGIDPADLVKAGRGGERAGTLRDVRNLDARSR
jgi:phosphatidylglycerol---prolipoprotein diacylglyceryl transferase